MKEVLTSVSVSSEDIYLATLRLSKYAPLVTSTLVNSYEIFPIAQNWTCCENDLKNYKPDSIHFGQKYATIFVLRHYLFLVAHRFPQAILLEKCSLIVTDNVHQQISQHLFAPNGVYCLFICGDESFFTEL